LRLPDERRRLAIMLDYQFGRRTSAALGKRSVRLVYSRRSGRVKLVFLDDELFATVRPNGSMAVSLEGARILAHRVAFLENAVAVSDEAAGFVRSGKSVFCKFVSGAGRKVSPGGDVAVVDGRGRVLGVGTAVLHGSVMQQFKSGVAVKVREGSAQ
jgi:predicted RNA-binding protein (TIGR00451 family)